MNDLDRRDFIRIAGLGATALAFPFGALAQDIPLEELTLAGMQRYSSRALTEAYLARIAALDKNIHSMIELNPDALAIADARDAERRMRRVRGPLHGIPIVIKDNIDTADRMRTTAGSLALTENVAARDAHIVRRLREAGAVLLGKTNLSEWANFRSTHSTSGWSARGGLTNNPYSLDRNCCGSSSGSGAAVSANFAAVGIGTETDGSIVCPASSCGLVGLKPTLGLVSRSGIIPIAHSQDTAGPMTRTVTDAAILLGAIAGVDSFDALTATSRGHVHADYTRFLDPNGLRGARIGVARQHFGFNDHVDRIMKDALDTLTKLGATLVDPANLATHNQYGDSEFEVLLHEFKHDLNAYLASANRNVKSRTLADLIKFNEENREREMPYFGQEIFLMAQEKGPLTDAKYKKALAKNHRMSRAQGIDATMKKHKLDALVAPTGGPVWTTDLINGDHYSGGYSAASAVSGYPHITVPAGDAFGLPVGLSFFAGAWSEPALLKYAFAFEQATNARKAPKVG
ncbi:MAG TPA: amidase [Thermoanaerobaculia bacterium]|jgi:amidase